MAGADDREGAAGIGPAAAPAVIGQGGLVGGVIGVGEFVVLGFGDPCEGDAQSAPQADALVFETAGQLPGKQLVMADLVGRDVAADLLQHRFLDGVAQGRVVGAGPGLDNAARDHLARTRAAARGGAVEIGLVAGLEAVEGGGEIEFGIDEFSPSPERLAVLDFLLAPAHSTRLEARIVVKDAAQMTRISAAVQFDQARRLDDRDDLRVELAAIEPVPANIVERPRGHAAPSGICNVPYTPAGNEITLVA